MPDRSALALRHNFVRDIRCYAAEDIDFFGDISDRVFDLNYRIDLADLNGIS